MENFTDEDLRYLRRRNMHCKFAISWQKMGLAESGITIIGFCKVT